MSRVWASKLFKGLTGLTSLDLKRIGAVDPAQQIGRVFQPIDSLRCEAVFRQYGHCCCQHVSLQENGMQLQHHNRGESFYDAKSQNPDLAPILSPIGNVCGSDYSAKPVICFAGY